MLLGAKLS